MIKTILLGLVLAGLVSATPLYTISITSAGHSYQVITPEVQTGHARDEYGTNAFSDSMNFKFWEEQHGVLVDSDIFVNTSGNVQDFLSNGYTKIPGGTLINSFYGYWDPRNAQSLTGSVTFDPGVKLIAVIVNSSKLSATDPFFIHPNGIAPGAFGSRGFESHDLTNSSVSGNTFHFSLAGNGSGDQMRFITTAADKASAMPDQTGAVPEPATYALVGSALIGLMALRRRK